MKPFNQEKCPIVSMEVGDFATHGDVVIERIEKLPDGFSGYEKQKDGVLAHGEMTGHCHMLEGGVAEVRVDPGNTVNRFIEIAETVVLKHQEHREITLPPGVYRSFLQQEYDPYTKKLRQVQD